MKTAQASLSSSAKGFASAQAEIPKLLKAQSFTCEVQMEDTDCFGIIHHSGLIKYYDRARQMALGSEKIAELDGAGAHMHISAMNKIGFCSTATLGMQLEVVTKVKDITGSRIIWEQTITNIKKNKLVTSALTQTTFHAWKDARSSNNPVATFAENGFSALDLSHVIPDMPSEKELPINCEFESTVEPDGAETMPDFLFQDGVDASGRLSHLSAFCMMERSRVKWLGGTKGLKRMQEEGVLAVVRSIDDFGQLIPCLPTANTPLTLRTSTRFISEHVVACHQDVCVHRGDGTLLPVAGGRVSIIFVNAKTMRPCDPPQWLVDKAAATLEQKMARK